ncbi:hypothetical protein BD310DRAFT_928306 [Dichomitus squalens]|uniref:Uncharacterized protein n=1 Tax=Dichomitus squalens TaxID=114155 RepID=A0A4Q9PU41_9APHY|nr:hypothetical protein BD310DRAFT_928306 [Dichomitus squalens]
MPSTNKRAPKVVVRPLARGSRSAGKVVLGRLDSLNVYGPVEGTTKYWEVPNPTPWKQASRSFPRFRRGEVCTRRNAGRDDGRTWMTSRYVCGSGLDEGCGRDYGWEQGHEEDDLDGLEDEALPGRAEEEEERTYGRVEIAIMDIAKPMKPRGPAKDYEVINSVGRVIALEDGHEWECEDDCWEAIEKIEPERTSYASVLQRGAA